MRVAVSIAALLAGAYADAVTVTEWDITTMTVTVRPGGGPEPTANAFAVSSSVHVETQHQPEQQAPQIQPQAQAQPMQASPQAAPQPESNDLGSIVSSLDPYKNAVLMSHNTHRALHNAPALTWSTELEQLADEQASGCVWGHQTNLGGTVYGQNIAAGMSPADIGNVITGLFYNNEEPAFAPYYGIPNPPGFEAWGHYTQVVWKATTQVGCVTKMCAGGLAGMSAGGMLPFYTVCNYSPAGNMEGQYAAQVSPPQN